MYTYLRISILGPVLFIQSIVFWHDSLINKMYHRLQKPRKIHLQSSSCRFSENGKSERIGSHVHAVVHGIWHTGGNWSRKRHFISLVVWVINLKLSKITKYYICIIPYVSRRLAQKTHINCNW